MTAITSFEGRVRVIKYDHKISRRIFFYADVTLSLKLTIASEAQYKEVGRTLKRTQQMTFS